MNTTRQDAWTKDEDIMLAETVIRYIREGKTQLEAFKEVAKELSRTSAACGFRWNATIRKQYYNAIQSAKETRKQGSENNIRRPNSTNSKLESDPIDTAILYLKRMKFNAFDQREIKQEKLAIRQLERDNEQLKEQLSRYDDAWREMGKLWSWVKESSTK